MKTVVQKYGGTSVNTKENRKSIIANINAALSDGLFPVIVVSAMGRFPSPYSTDAFISLLPDVTQTHARSKDLISSVGEIISAVVVSEELRLNGLKAMPLTGGQAGIITDDNFGEGKILDIDASRLEELIARNIIPVIAGFQGCNSDGDILTLGRGGSDITATALGAALNSELVEIYTDVDGVMTADPNVVDDAELIGRIEYKDVFMLAEYGAKVIHPRAVEFAMKANVPVAVLNVNKSREGHHTIISDECDIPRGKSTFSAVVAKEGNSQVEVKFSDLKKEDEMYMQLAEKNISIDMINIFADRKIFIIETVHKKRIMKILSALDIEGTVTDGFTKITVLGNYIVGVPGIIAKIVAALYGNEIPVYQSSDSSNTISVLVKSESAEKAVNILHRSLIQN